jgi:DNA-binding Lrp family transcriptional regulator
MENKILNLLKENSRISCQEIADRLNITEKEAAEILKNLEDKKIICGYTVIINEAALNEVKKVQALIEVKVTPQRDGGFDKVAKRIALFDEVKELALVSGGYDLLLTVEGDNLQEVAGFVSEKLSTIDGVLSTATSFQLKKYKEAGRTIEFTDDYERLKVCP